VSSIIPPHPTGKFYERSGVVARVWMMWLDAVRNSLGDLHTRIVHVVNVTNSKPDAGDIPTYQKYEQWYTTTVTDAERTVLNLDFAYKVGSTTVVRDNRTYLPGIDYYEIPDATGSYTRIQFVYPIPKGSVIGIRYIPEN